MVNHSWLLTQSWLLTHGYSLPYADATIPADLYDYIKGSVIVPTPIPNAPPKPTPWDPSVMRNLTYNMERIDMICNITVYGSYPSGSQPFKSGGSCQGEDNFWDNKYYNDSFTLTLDPATNPDDRWKYCQVGIVALWVQIRSHISPVPLPEDALDG